MDELEAEMVSGERLHRMMLRMRCWHGITHVHSCATCMYVIQNKELDPAKLAAKQAQHGERTEWIKKGEL